MIRKKDIIGALEREAVEKLSSNASEEVPSEAARRIYALFREVPDRRKTVLISRRTLAALCTAACLMVLLLAEHVGVYAIPFWRDSKINTLIKLKGADYAFNLPEGIYYPTVLRLPTYYPAGYSTPIQTNTPKSLENCDLILQNHDNKFIILKQMTTYTAGIISGEQKDAPLINGTKAEAIEDKDGFFYLIWQYDGYYFILGANALPLEEQVKMAESIK